MDEEVSAYAGLDGGQTCIQRDRRPDVENLIDLELRTIRERYAVFLGVAAVEAFIASGAVEELIRGAIGRAQVVTVNNEVRGYGVATGDHIDQLMVDVRVSVPDCCPAWKMSVLRSTIRSS